MTPSAYRKLIINHRKPTLLTFDAFGTLFRPRVPIAQLYADGARRHGLEGVSENEIADSFRKVLGQQKAKYPNYGKSIGQKPSEWWADVIRLTFRPYFEPKPLPEGLIPDLWEVFTTQRGYELCPGVLSFFNWLKEVRTSLRSDRICPGIITNSDDRVPFILSCLGLEIVARGYDASHKGSPTKEGLVARSGAVPCDFNFIAMSYDIGFEKPSREIFDAALRLSGHTSSNGVNCVHVGDSVEHDYHGPLSAGWQAIIVRRFEEWSDEEAPFPQNALRVPDFHKLRELLDESPFRK